MAITFEQIHFRVFGKVQGVGFRYATQRSANSLGIAGWVRNTPDLAVEVWAQGEKTQVETFLSWCHHGPEMARVDKVDVLERSAVAGLTTLGFEIRR